MTIDETKLPFRETLVVDVTEFAKCPRVACCSVVSSRASESDPALLCVPSAPSTFLGLQLCSVAIAVVAASSPDDVLVNVCLKLMDGCGRPYGPSLPLASAMCSPNGVATAFRVSVPLNRGQRAAIFVRHNGGDGFHCTASLFGHAILTSFGAASDARVTQALSKMLKNSGMDELEAVMQAAAGNTTTCTKQRTSSKAENVSSAGSAHSSESNRKRLRDAPAAQETSSMSRKASSSSVSQRSQQPADGESEAPPLIYTFVPGSADES